MITEAQKKATIKYQKNNYDKIMVLFPKSTKDRIKNSGDTINGFIVKSVLEALNKKGL